MDKDDLDTDALKKQAVEFAKDKVVTGLTSGISGYANLIAPFSKTGASWLAKLQDGIKSLFSKVLDMLGIKEEEAAPQAPVVPQADNNAQAPAANPQPKIEMPQVPNHKLAAKQGAAK